jgi:hypothetical protein
MLAISLYNYLYLKVAKTLCLFFFFTIAYVFSSTKLEKKAEQALPGSEGVEGQREGAGGRGQGDGPNNAGTCE